MKNAHKEILSLLNEEFTRLKTKNSSFSLRAFSKRMNLPVSALSGILNNRYPITKKTGEKVLAALAIDPKRTSVLLNALQHRSPSAKHPSVTPEYIELRMDDFHMIANWYYFGILSLAETEGFNGSAIQVCQRLGIQLRQAKSALERLENMGLLVRNKTGRLVHSGKPYQTSQGIPNTYLRKHHQENLELARRSMEEDEFEQCDFSGITMAIDPAKLPEAKKRITKFRRELCQFLESEQKKQVYRMNFQLFPLSERKQKDKK